MKKEAHRKRDKDETSRINWRLNTRKHTKVNTKRNSPEFDLRKSYALSQARIPFYLKARNDRACMRQAKFEPLINP